eukprot:SAG31_NODE_31654_length_365_cov_1.665414_1_plen_36_part_01
MLESKDGLKLGRQKPSILVRWCECEGLRKSWWPKTD